MACILVSGAEARGGDDLGDHAEFCHGMEVRTRLLDGIPVVTHYGEIRPDFADRADNAFRRRIPLDGKWNFAFDPEGKGMAEEWFHTTTGKEDWQMVTVPHCWDAMEGGRFGDWSDCSVKNPPFYNGAAWYRKTFELDLRKGRGLRLEFLGVQQRARVFLNGKLLGLHEGGGQPFSLEVTDAVQPGRNVLALQVIRLPNYEVRKEEGKRKYHELSTTHTQHPMAPDNWPYAGILRPVHLVEEALTTVRKTQVRVRDGKLEADVFVSNRSSGPVQAEVVIESPALAKAVYAGVKIPVGGNRAVRLQAVLREGVAQWSPGSPALHELSTRLRVEGVPVDQVMVRFGVRELALEDSRFVLNGDPVFLKGTAFYEEHPVRGGAMRREDHEQHFQLARSAKANFLRLHVAQRDPVVYRLADEQGMMICGEWGGFWYKEKSMDAQTKDDRSVFLSLARCAVWDLMNHPSVVMWGLHNESHQFCPEYEPFVRRAREVVQEIDLAWRPITWAAWHPHFGQPHFEYADLVGFNEYRGAMDPFERLDPDLKKATAQNPGKPLIILENGGWSTRGKRGKVSWKGTEDWQADLLRRQHEVLIRHTPPLAGYTYWIMTDYRSRKPYTQGSDHGWSRMGMYDEDGKPKLVRDVFRDLEWTPARDARGP